MDETITLERHTRPMRLVIAASPKTGNVWLECLLAHIYRVQVLDSSGEWDYRAWTLPPGGFITHQHLQAVPDVLAWADEKSVRFVTIIRHPCDVFLSIYHYVNNFAAAWARRGLIGSSPSHAMVGQPLDGPVVADYLRDEFYSDVLATGLGWMEQPDVPLVRYEDLHSQPVETLKAVTERLCLVGERAIQSALEHCDIDRMRKRSEHLKLHCREGKSGGWRRNLPPGLQALMRERHGEICHRLGYTLDDE